MSTTSSGQLRRAVDFVEGIQDRGAQRRVPFEWGTALFNDDFPRVHDLNFLRVENAPQDVTPEALAEEADRLLGILGRVKPALQGLGREDASLRRRLGPERVEVAR